ncbi:MAG: hypothetical protein E3K32_11595 [wastewater metagenome]|nr:hypothetical protein [Candidatus Loosdrechtia aerotolerans]
MMFFRQLVSLLREMYLSGGVEVRTRFDNASISDPSLCAWTLIQPDGDIINKISERVLDQPDNWHRHLENVEQKMAILRRFRSSLKWISVSSIPFLISTGCTAWIFRENIRYMIIISAGGTVFSISSLLVRFLTGCILQWYVRRKLIVD